MSPPAENPGPCASRTTGAPPAGQGKFVVVIPAYNHARRIKSVITEALKLNLPVIVVDDGSTDATAELIRTAKGIHALRHPKNLGKGAALLTGFAEAAKIGDWAVTIDADGQHHPRDARQLMAAIPENTRPIIVGLRQQMNAPAVPWTSRFGRTFSNFWIRMAGGPPIEDSQSGFRIYPLPESLNLAVAARRFQFEIEVLVRAFREDIPVLEIPVGVTYERDGHRVSHFRPFVDFCRNTGTFARLITRRVLVHPFTRKR